jgi:hypothetical protein
MVLIQPASAASVTSAVDLYATTVPRGALVGKGQGYTADSAAGQDVEARDKPGQGAFGDKLGGKTTMFEVRQERRRPKPLTRAMVD